MQTLDLTLPSPEKNLALDEALLLDAEAGTGTEILRFWMSPTPFVVVGLGAKIEREVNLDVCAYRKIPILRRCSGGGTVVQGPGCLNYSLILRIAEDGPLETIQRTNHFIMERNVTSLNAILERSATCEGHTDLAIDGVKVSGNAQRRLRTHLLFHGTFLLHLDLTLITELLPMPHLQPDYRRRRSHGDFVTNLGIAANELKQALRRTWNSTALATANPSQRVGELVENRYARQDWNFRR